MIKDYRKLLSVLEGELKVQEKLLELLNQERVAVAGLQHEQISKISADKEELLAEAKSFEEQRRLSVAEHFPEADGKKLTQLIETLPLGPSKTSLLSVTRRLKATVHLVQELHTHNSQLIRHALGIVAGTVSVIYQAATAAPTTYGESGNIREEKAKTAPRVGSLAREA